MAIINASVVSSDMLDCYKDPVILETVSNIFHLIISYVSYW